MSYTKTTFVEGGAPGITPEELNKFGQALYLTNNIFTTTGSANVYATTIAGIASLTDIVGVPVQVKINVDATGASTLNVNSYGAIAFKKANGASVTNFKANGVYTVVYDGTNFQLQGEGASGNATASDLLSGKTASTDAGDIVGNIPSKGAQTYTPGTTNQTIAAEQYLSGIQTILGDADLISENIISGKNIFGVAGGATIESLGGKKWAEGTLTTPGTKAYVNFYTYHYFEVRGLAFKPKYVFAIQPGAVSLSSLWGEINTFLSTLNIGKSHGTATLITVTTDGTTPTGKEDTLYNDGFRVIFDVVNANQAGIQTSMYWIAIE